MKIRYIQFYLSWANQFLTLEYYCSYHEITRRQAKRYIKAGRMLYYGVNKMSKNYGTIQL